MLVAPLRVQLCPKLLIVDELKQTALLCRRTGEADFDAHFSLVGGKLENGDLDLIAGIAREVREEIGVRVRIEILLTFSVDVLFEKQSGEKMVLPHYYARFHGGELELNEQEYGEACWVSLASLGTVDQIVPNVPDIAARLCRLLAIATADDFHMLP